MIGPGALCAAALLLADAAGADKVEVINAESYFPDGPLCREVDSTTPSPRPTGS